jgi:hypothetical protein
MSGACDASRDYLRPKPARIADTNAGTKLGEA